MAEDDTRNADDSAEAPYTPTGLRRSTYTPPTTASPPSFLIQADSGDADGDDNSSQLVADGEDLRPHRTSLQDEDLVRKLSPAADTATSTLDAIEEFQAELDLREREARKFAEWEGRMRAIGTPEALESITEAIPEFTGVIPIISAEAARSAGNAQPLGTPTLAPDADSGGASPDGDSIESEPGLHPGEAPLPRLDERVEAVPIAELNLSDHVVFEPPWKRAVRTDSADLDASESETTAGSTEPEGEAEPEPKPKPAAEVEEQPIVYELVDPGVATVEPAADTPQFAVLEALLNGANSSLQSDDAKPFISLSATIINDAAVEIELPAVAEAAISQTPDLFVEGGIPRGIALGPFAIDAEAVTLPVAAPVTVAAVSSGENRARVFSVELSGDEATPLEQRIGRAARMFWLWFATNSSVVSVVFGAVLFSLGMSLRQAILAVFIGVAISFLPLGLGTLAGKWSGQPTIVVSRATFGLAGNIVPAVLAFVTRLFWGAVLLWLVAVGTARVLVGASLAGPFDELQLTFIAATVGMLLVIGVAFLGYALLARIQLILSIVSAVLIVGLLAVTWHAVDIRAALTVGDGPWILVVTGVVLVFSFIGLVWALSSGDIARYQRPGSSGAASSLWASFGATLPAFVLISYGALLAASNQKTSSDLLSAPLDTIALMIPTWYPVPLLAATVLSLLAGAALSLYSGGFALTSIGVRLPRQWSVLLVGVVMFAITLLVIASGTGISGVFRDFATSLAVPVAAWAGIFGAEVMIRHRRFDEKSLLARGGIYPAVNWVNLVMLFAASAIGFAFTTASVAWLSWQGFGFALLRIPLDSVVAGSDLGVIVALLLGLATPLVAGISVVRRQEQAVPQGESLAFSGT